MTDDIENVETENAELSETSELESVASVVEELAAAEAGETVETADTVDTEPFVATDTQRELAKQLGFDDEYVANMTPEQAAAADQFGRAQSRLAQRQGKPPQKKEEEVETSESAESSTDDEFLNEDDLYTPEGVAKINNLAKELAALKAKYKNTELSEQDRLQEGIDKVFDELDPDIFEKYLPGETADIEAGSKAEAKRQEAVNMAKAIQGASTTDISMEDALKQALAVVAPAETQKAAESKDNDRRQKRSKQRISAPSPEAHKHKKHYDSPEEEAIDKIYAAVNA
jgi:hypothetical protein